MSLKQVIFSEVVSFLVTKKSIAHYCSLSLFQNDNTVQFKEMTKSVKFIGI